jgi:hypothetical protein
MTVLFDGAMAAFDTCPLCGNKLIPPQAERARLGLPKGSASEDPVPVDRPEP